ncbi:SURF1 family protein [Shewanella subflava]|nr:SURF1 family protein [Shewanella subflava]
MNTSNSTKTNLTNNGAVTGNPLAGLGWAGFVFIAITVAVFSILVKLGLWQLERAEFKTSWDVTLKERQNQAAMNFDSLLQVIDQHTADTNAEQQTLTGYRIALSASPVSKQVLLLDNQIYMGQVGYLAYQVFQVNASSPNLLVELGFVPADKDRRILPDISAISTGRYKLIGRIYQKQINPLSENLMAEIGNPMRFQNLAIDELSQLLGYPLLPVVLQPDNVPDLNLPQPWQPIPLSAQKHQGYALQWFTMAAVFLGLMAWLAHRKWQSGAH